MSTQHRESTDETGAYRAALERAETLRAYYTHLLVYGVVTGVLFFVNLLTRGDDGSWWFLWSLAGWGILVLIHTLVVFGSALSQDWKLRKADEIYRRRQNDFTP
ncbi:MAG TPA: 2TM domain-containing protein [Actinomycetota bacterium]